MHVYMYVYLQDANGHLATQGKSTCTSVPGIFAAGDRSPEAPPPSYRTLSVHACSASEGWIKISEAA